MTAPSSNLADLGSSLVAGDPHRSHHAGSARRHTHSTASSHPGGHHHRGSFTTLVTDAAHRRTARAALPPEVTGALQTAMSKEGVPPSWAAPLQFIIGKESSGQVGASNGADSARGLFQLTRASYHLNPNGAQSFGNPVEEAQGGIRYIERRYQTADNAATFWQRHGWY